jgi:hypothetical protein
VSATRTTAIHSPCQLTDPTGWALSTQARLPDPQPPTRNNPCLVPSANTLAALLAGTRQARCRHRQARVSQAAAPSLSSSRFVPGPANRADLALAGMYLCTFRTFVSRPSVVILQVFRFLTLLLSLPLFFLSSNNPVFPFIPSSASAVRIPFSFGVFDRQTNYHSFLPAAPTNLSNVTAIDTCVAWPDHLLSQTSKSTSLTGDWNHSLSNNSYQLKTQAFQPATSNNYTTNAKEHKKFSQDAHQERYCRGCSRCHD